MDVATAFLNGELTEQIYTWQPEGFVECGKENLVCTTSDPCLYVLPDSDEETFIVAVYVDDIILSCSSPVKMNLIKKELCQKFEMKDLGALHHFLGVKIDQDKLCGLVNLKFPKCTNSKPVGSPVNPGTKLAASRECIRKSAVLVHKDMP